RPMAQHTTSLDHISSSNPLTDTSMQVDPPISESARLFRETQSVGLQDTHRVRTGGSMASIRSRPDRDTDGLEALSFVAEQAREQRGMFYTGPTEQRGMPGTPLRSSVPDRRQHPHTPAFALGTGGERSATRYQEQLGTRVQGTDYEIAHGTAFSHGGPSTNTP